MVDTTVFRVELSQQYLDYTQDMWVDGDGSSTCCQEDKDKVVAGRQSTDAYMARMLCLVLADTVCWRVAAIDPF